MSAHGMESAPSVAPNVWLDAWQASLAARTLLRCRGTAISLFECSFDRRNGRVTLSVSFALQDPVANLQAYSACVKTCDALGDGDWLLVVANLDKKLKARRCSLACVAHYCLRTCSTAGVPRPPVLQTSCEHVHRLPQVFKGTSLFSEHKLLETPVGADSECLRMRSRAGWPPRPSPLSLCEESVRLCSPTGLVVFYGEAAGPRIPALAVAAGSSVYIYRNLRPYYRVRSAAGWPLSQAASSPPSRPLDRAPPPLPVLCSPPQFMLPPVNVDPGEKAAWEDYKNAVRSEPHPPLSLFRSPRRL